MLGLLIPVILKVTKKIFFLIFFKIFCFFLKDNTRKKKQKREIKDDDEGQESELEDGIFAVKPKIKTEPKGLFALKKYFFSFF